MSLKKPLLTGLFLLNGLLTTAQTKEEQPDPYAPGLREQKQKTEALLILKCRHSDRKTPYREFNPGLLFLQHANENSSLQRGGYFNSNYGFSTTTGTLAEFKTPVGKNFYASAGVMAGISFYARKERNEVNVRIFEKSPLAEDPRNSRKRGYQVSYHQLDDGRWVQIEEVRKPRGKGPQHPRVMILFIASFMHNSDNGVSGLFAVGPNLGTNGGVGTLSAVALRFNTDPVYNYIMR